MVFSGSLWEVSQAHHCLSREAYSFQVATCEKSTPLRPLPPSKLINVSVYISFRQAHDLKSCAPIIQTNNAEAGSRKTDDPERGTFSLLWEQMTTSLLLVATLCYHFPFCENLREAPFLCCFTCAISFFFTLFLSEKWQQIKCEKIELIASRESTRLSI